MGASPAVHVARSYHLPPDHDGTRVLVDRLWPRGLRKDDAPMDLWCKEVASSNELRYWYGHDPALFAEFSARYQAELADPARAAAPGPAAGAEPGGPADPADRDQDAGDQPRRGAGQAAERSRGLILREGSGA